MFFIVLLLITGCATTGIIEDDYLSALGKYKRGKYSEVIDQLGRFKSQNPYDRDAIAAELLIADSQFALKQYEEALYAYQRFAQLHPHHKLSAYILFQIGNVYWAQAPAATNRDQNKTHKAMAVWHKLTERYPNSDEAGKAKALLLLGNKRIMDSIAAIAKFYCAQGAYHSCAYRYLELAKTYNDKAAFAKAASALEALLKRKQATPTDKSNIYFNLYSTAALKRYIASIRQKSLSN